MTLQDLIDFLLDEAHRQTLTEQEVRRCLLLAYEMGYDLGRQVPAGPARLTLDLDPDVPREDHA